VAFKTFASTACSVYGPVGRLGMVTGPLNPPVEFVVNVPTVNAANLTMTDVPATAVKLVPVTITVAPGAAEVGDVFSDVTPFTVNGAVPILTPSVAETVWAAAATLGTTNVPEKVPVADVFIMVRLTIGVGPGVIETNDEVSCVCEASSSYRDNGSWRPRCR